MFLRLIVAVHTRILTAFDAAERRRPPRLCVDRGQATAEYALVLLGAAVVAIALITWATTSGRIGQLFNRVFDELQSRL